MANGRISVSIVALYFLFVMVRHPSQRVSTEIPIRICSEAAFDDALSFAQDGNTIRFMCSGDIPITTAKQLTHSINLIGSKTVTLTGKHVWGILQIAPLLQVTIHDLSISGSAGDSSGGGAITNYGYLQVSGGIFADNAQAVYNAAGATTIISDSLIKHNEHGILNYGGTLRVNAVTFADNIGDGIYNSSELVVLNSTFRGNSHGIDNGNGTVMIANSLFYKNKTQPHEMGAGIANSGELTVLNSTFWLNESNDGGAAIGNHKGGHVILRNTVLAGSDSDTNCFGPITDSGHNLQYPDISCGETITNRDPRLSMGLLEAYSHSQFYKFAIPIDSPLVNAGDPETCKTAPVNNRDIGGRHRTDGSDASCDIGAFEISLPAVVAVNN